MSVWNYVATAHEPTTVTSSRFGNFTDAKDFNLIVAKCTLIEIHQIGNDVSPIVVQHFYSIPIFGRIAALELIRPVEETQDLLLVLTEKYGLFVFKWDATVSHPIIRRIHDLSIFVRSPTENGPICIVDPECRLIGLHLSEGVFTVIRLGNDHNNVEAVTIRPMELKVLDIKFLYGCPEPTIAVLYQDVDGTHMQTYVVNLKDQHLDNISWSLKNLAEGAVSLIPVPHPLCGVLINCKETIIYSNISSVNIKISITPSIERAYGRIDANGSRYLLGDQNGNLHLLNITHEKEKVTGLTTVHLGETSVASSISHIHRDFVFVGSSSGDSQLIKLNLEPNAEGSYVEVIELFVNLGPIVDFCVVDIKKQGQGQVVTCSGAYKDGSLRVACNGTGIKEQVSVKLKGINGMWSLRSDADLYDTFLVVSSISKTHILAMDLDCKLEETEIEGFSSDVQTLFCHNAIHGQFVQVTSKEVRLISSTTKALCDTWIVPKGRSVNVATANAAQVLLAIADRYLVYLEVGAGKLIYKREITLECVNILCLHMMNPSFDNSRDIKLAAVGMSDNRVGIFSLSKFKFITKERLGGERIPHSLLLCSFEGISYLLCALRDGHLLNFVLNTSNGQLEDMKNVSLGTQPITLHTFSSKNATQAFAASDRPTLIYSSNKKLLYSNVNLEGVGHMCPVNPASFPNSVAIAKEGKVSVGTVDDIPKLHTRSIPLGEHARRICHEKQTQTFAICTVKYNQSSAKDPEMHYIRLLDDQTFDFLSSFQLDEFERGCSIVSCSFSGDRKRYCVGTAYVKPEEDTPTKGRLLVFAIEDRKLKLVVEAETPGGVISLVSFKERLLAAINHEVMLYGWVCDGRSGKLDLQDRCPGSSLVFDVQARGNSIFTSYLLGSFSLGTCENGTIQSICNNSHDNWTSAFGILDREHFVSADDNFNLVTFRKGTKPVTHQRRKYYADYLEVVGHYHLGEFVNRFRKGSLVMQLPDSDGALIPTIIYGTASGVIGVIASLPDEKYSLLEKLQTNIQKFFGTWEPINKQWRSFYNDETAAAKNFLDGDCIKLFHFLSRNQMDEISNAMTVPVDVLKKSVEELTRLH